MDILLYLPSYRVMVCKPCGIAVAPHRLQAHLNKLHVEQSTALASRDLVRRFVNETLPSILDSPLLDPRKENVHLPDLDCEALPGLRILQGLGCNSCGYVCKGIDQIRQHHNVEHASFRKHRGGPRKKHSSTRQSEIDHQLIGGQPPWHTACYQRFFGGGRGSQCFRVVSKLAGSTEKGETIDSAADLGCSGSETITDKVMRQLKEIESRSKCVKDTPAKSEVSPWLERTRWTGYLEGFILSEVHKLGRPAEAQSEPLLQILSCSVDRLVESAYLTVCSDKVNYFGQRCISSFLPAKRMYNRPLLVKLQATTYKRYKESWKRLLAFVYRTNIIPATGNQLRHRLTSHQTALFDKLLSRSLEVLNSRSDETVLEQLKHGLDDICLDFCIALLDHDLKGDLFESAILGYLDVMGIDIKSSRFHEAHSYTPLLSGFIKISQMLVLEKALRSSEKRQSGDPLDFLEEMRERFMTVDCRSPFSWAVQLRSFGKKIRDSTTSIGYIQFFFKSYCIQAK